MGVQKVNGVDLQNLENQLGQKYQEIQQQVNKLNTTIDNLEGQWEGIGAGAFDAKQRRINEDLRVIGRILDGFTDSIRTTRTMSGNTEDDVAQRMNKLEAGGGLASGGGPDTTQGEVAGMYPSSKLAGM